MPKHVRVRLLHSLEKLLDDSWEFQELERLTKKEKSDLMDIRLRFLDLKEETEKLIAIVASRGELQLPPRKMDGPSFSWAEHDARCKIKNDAQCKIKRLEKELSQTCKKLAEVECAR